MWTWPNTELTQICLCDMCSRWHMHLPLGPTQHDKDCAGGRHSLADDCLMMTTIVFADVEPVRGCHHGKFWLLDARLIYTWAASSGRVHPSVGGIWPRSHVSVDKHTVQSLCLCACQHSRTVAGLSQLSHPHVACLKHFHPLTIASV